MVVSQPIRAKRNGIATIAKAPAHPTRANPSGIRAGINRPPRANQSRLRNTTASRATKRRPSQILRRNSGAKRMRCPNAKAASHGPKIWVPMIGVARANRVTKTAARASLLSHRARKRPINPRASSSTDAGCISPARLFLAVLLGRHVLALNIIHHILPLFTQPFNAQRHHISGL